MAKNGWKGFNFRGMSIKQKWFVCVKYPLLDTPGKISENFNFSARLNGSGAGPPCTAQVKLPEDVKSEKAFVATVSVDDVLSGKIIANYCSL